MTWAHVLCAALASAAGAAMVLLLMGRAIRASLHGARLRAIDDGGFVLDLRARGEEG